jgi:hypothetical protein
MSTNNRNSTPTPDEAALNPRPDSNNEDTALLDPPPSTDPIGTGGK